LTHNLARNEVQKITKYENLALEIKKKYIWKPNNVCLYPPVISGEELVTKTFLKYLQNIGLTKYILRSVAKSNNITNVSQSKVPSFRYGT
jgi:hypothetical protein